jgi:hypothetical protein
VKQALPSSNSRIIRDKHTSIKSYRSKLGTNTTPQKNTKIGHGERFIDKDRHRVLIDNLLSSASQPYLALCPHFLSLKRKIKSDMNRPAEKQ